MNFPTPILAILYLAFLIQLWTIWRSVIRRSIPSGASLEKSCGVAAIFLLMAASSALTIGNRVAFNSSVRCGPVAPFEWIPTGVMVFSVLIAGGFLSVAGLLYFQRRESGQQDSKSS